MDALEMTGRTVEEAIDKAMRQLGVGPDDVEVVVVDRGRGGILGLGSEQARVRVTLRSTDPVDLAKQTIETLLRTMSVDATVGLPERPSQRIGPKPEEAVNSGLSFNIDGEDAGLLIGRRGETLGAFQFLVNFILARRSAERVHVTIDVEGYRERRNEVLRAMALRMADRAAASGRSISLEPMPARERRVIHITLAGNSRVTTESVGEGDERKVTIIPKRTGGRPQGRPGGRPQRRYR